MLDTRKDQDAAKGAKELDGPTMGENLGLRGQLGHRDQEPMLKDADSDFPEPGLSPEHSGEPQKKTA